MHFQVKAISKPDALEAEKISGVAIAAVPEAPAEEGLDISNAEGTPQLPVSYMEASSQLPEDGQHHAEASQAGDAASAVESAVELSVESGVVSAVEHRKLGEFSVPSSATDVATVQSPLQHYAGKVCSGGRCRYTARKHAGQNRLHAASDKPLPEVIYQPLGASTDNRCGIRDLHPDPS